MNTIFIIYILSLFVLFSSSIVLSKSKNNIGNVTTIHALLFIVVFYLTKDIVLQYSQYVDFGENESPEEFVENMEEKTQTIEVKGLGKYLKAFSEKDDIPHHEHDTELYGHDNVSEPIPLGDSLASQSSKSKSRSLNGEQIEISSDEIGTAKDAATAANTAKDAASTAAAQAAAAVDSKSAVEAATIAATAANEAANEAATAIAAADAAAADASRASDETNANIVETFTIESVATSNKQKLAGIARKAMRFSQEAIKSAEAAALSAAAAQASVANISAQFTTTTPPTTTPPTTTPPIPADSFVIKNSYDNKYLKDYSHNERPSGWSTTLNKTDAQLFVIKATGRNKYISNIDNTKFLRFFGNTLFVPNAQLTGLPVGQMGDTINSNDFSLTNDSSVGTYGVIFQSTSGVQQNINLTAEITASSSTTPQLPTRGSFFPPPLTTTPELPTRPPTTTPQLPTRDPFFPPPPTTTPELPTRPPTTTPELPTKPGCYVHNEKGCPKRKNTDRKIARRVERGWYKDRYGMRNKDSGKSKEKCDERVANYNNWCETTGFESHFNPTNKQKRGPIDFSTFFRSL